MIVNLTYIYIYYIDLSKMLYEMAGYISNNYHTFIFIETGTRPKTKPDDNPKPQGMSHLTFRSHIN